MVAPTSRVIAFALLLPLNLAAHACGCAKPKVVADVALSNPAYHFKGSVESVLDVPSEIGSVQEVRFRILELIKGVSANTVTVRFQQGGTSCDLEKLGFNRGQAYLISAQPINWVEGYRGPNAPVVYSNNFCSLRHRLD